MGYTESYTYMLSTYRCTLYGSIHTLFMHTMCAIVFWHTRNAHVTQPQRREVNSGMCLDQRAKWELRPSHACDKPGRVHAVAHTHIRTDQINTHLHIEQNRTENALRTNIHAVRGRVKTRSPNTMKTRKRDMEHTHKKEASQQATRMSGRM